MLNDKSRHLAVVSIHPLYDTRIAGHLVTLADAGYRVSYVNWSGQHEMPSDAQVRPIKVVHHIGNPAIGGRLFRYLRLLLWFFIQVARLRPNIIHIHDLVLLPVVMLKWCTGARVVFDVHEDYLNFTWGGGINRYAKLFYKFFLPQVDGIVSISRKVLPDIEKPYEIIPNYQERSSFHRFQTTETNRDMVTLVYFGSLSTLDRDVDLLLDVAELCLEQHPRVVCKFGGPLRGPGSEANLSRMEQLQRTFPERFHWFGEMRRDDVIRHTATADVGLYLAKGGNANLIESSPNKIYEYLSVGAVIVSTSGFEIGAEVESEGAGFLFPPGVDAANVADKVLSLADNRERLASMQSASARLGTKYSWSEVAGRYVRLYKVLEGSTC